MNEDEQYEYLKKFHERLERNSALKTARNKGLRMGREEGIAQGLEEGRAEGLAEGEAKARLDTAKNLVAAGVAWDIISQCTGLSISEIQALL